MKKLSITNLASIIQAGHEPRDTSDCFTGVSIDSRTIKPGDCFFALAGDNHDGHNFLADAFAKGASCAVVSKAASISNQQSAISNKVILKVDDTVQALGTLAAWYRKDCNFKVIAITGSVGKTTTRQIIYHVLSRQFKTHQPVKNFNNFIGLPLTFLAAPPDCQIVIAELGANHPGEIGYLAKICSPDIALITAVAPAHLEGFGDLETLTKEKLSISQGLNSKGTLILNGDCTGLVDLAKKQRKKFLTFGSNPQFDYCFKNLHSDGLSSDFEISNCPIEKSHNCHSEQSEESHFQLVHLPLPGLGNAYNALAAWAVADQFKITPSDFADALKTISPVSMRTELLQIGSLTVINDCYNANPASMKNALDILTTLAKNQNRSPASGRSPHDSFCAVPLCGNKQNGGGRRAIFICGDMAELGDHTEKLHIELGRLIAESNLGLLLTVGHLALLAADTAKNVSPALETHSFLRPEQLCDNLHKLIKDSDIILVKGSRINKLELVVDKLKRF